MESNLFASEWQILQENRQKLNEQIAQLKRALNNFTQEPEIKQLLEERELLYDKVREVKDKIQHHKHNISSMQELVKQRKWATTDDKMQANLDTLIERRKICKAQLIETGAPKEKIESQEQFIWELQAPIAEVEKKFRQQIVGEKEKQKELESIFEEMLINVSNSILAIEEHYRKTKKSFKETLAQMELRKIQYRDYEVEWGTKDINHLRWMLENNPSYRDDLISAYKVRFPNEDLSCILLQSISASTPRQNGLNTNKKRCHCCLTSPPIIAEENVKLEPQPWKFWITFNSNDSGQELPQERDQFLKKLTSVLEKEKCNNLRADLVYEKLIEFVSLSRQQRKQVRRVKRKYMGPLKGCTILDVRRGGHRLFLWFNETDRHIRFLFRPRKEAYKQI